MDTWVVGLIVVCAAVLGVIVYGALSDRAKNRRAAAEILSPPRRDIPQFQPDAASPHYLSELQARRTPEDADPTDLSQAEREQLAQLIKTGVATRIDCGFASKHFITDPPSSWAVLDNPRVLVCAEPVAVIREVITILEKLILSRTPLVVVAPALGPELLATLEVNKIRRMMPLLAVLAKEESMLYDIAAITGATPVSRTDLQASYVTVDQLGCCDRWVSTAKTSYILGPQQAADGSADD